MTISVMAGRLRAYLTALAACRNDKRRGHADGRHV